MTPILARIGTAIVIGAASFVNLHPCAAADVERLGGRVAAIEDAAEVSAPPNRAGHDMVIYRPTEDARWPRASCRDSQASGS